MKHPICAWEAALWNSLSLIFDVQMENSMNLCNLPTFVVHMITLEAEVFISPMFI